MTLKEQLSQQFKEAMKAKDTVLKDTIQIIRAGVLQIEKDNKVELDDSGVIDVISRELKKRYDVLPDYERSGRADALAELQRQIEILKSYLPEQLSEAEVMTAVQDTIAELGLSGPRDMGKAMKALTEKLRGRADNKLVSEYVKKCLSGQ